ncbi:MAG: C-terminal binding protein [Nitrospinota bacterium]|jgi:D-3-phosphoglycerate dehydrogenase|nr:C-terminal binding protein [Nitrospinota bacterium]MDP6483621.1 C-terminal binding protein [Nitrospinota bacterium]MDP7385321.1 C-terminal binding protein [Nitrospinota bacterium]HJM43950.1 C-terminal binding protein [Nitrospinota bacterium]
MASDPIKVVLTDYVWESLEPEESLFRSLDVEFLAIQCKSTEELVEAARGARVLLNTYFAPLDRSLFEALPSLKMIARYGIGVDTIDLEAATDHGIIVTNNPTYCLDEVAEHTLALLLAMARNIAVYDRDVRRGVWDVEAAKPMHRIAGKTLGVLGLGSIARKVAARARAFEMRVLYHDPYVPAEEGEKEGVEAASLDRLFEESDFLTVHTPLLPDTRHMIGEAQLRRMKPTACLINCARGPIVDNEALVRALSEGWIAAAGLDVVEDPPPLSPDHPLLSFPRNIVTPHSAWYSEEAMEGLHEGAPAEAARFLRGERPLHVVNPKVLENLGR